MRVLMAKLRRIRDRLQTQDPIIHLYCLCWNEERMLPFFFRHYDALVARYFVFDNGSTDRSTALLAAHPKVTLGQFRPVQGSVIGEAPDFYETVWRASRGVDWIFIVNIDEFLHHPDGLDYFKFCIRQGITAIAATGYQMVAETFPHHDQTLSDSITYGVRYTKMDKLCAFRPYAVKRLNFGPGRHTAKPRGHIVYPAKPELSLLHYKYLGESYLVERYAELRARTADSDRKRGWGQQYFDQPTTLIEGHRKLMAAAEPVPGLKSSGGAAPTVPATAADP